MRRWVSISFVLFFGLWPLTGTLQACDDSNLPVCCRRHGSHHCAMSTQMAAMMAQTSSMPGLQAPTTCPLFPGFVKGASAPSHALVAQVASLPALLEQVRQGVARLDYVRMRPFGPDAGRGPPSSIC